MNKGIKKALCNVMRKDSLIRKENIYISGISGISKRSLINVALLYIVAAICESLWLVVLGQNFDLAKKWFSLPVIGWVMELVFLGIVIIIPTLLVIGISFYRLVKKAVAIRSTVGEIKRIKHVKSFLTIAIIADVVVSLFLLIYPNTFTDKSGIIFIAAMFGVKTLQANIEAIMIYFSNKKNNSNNQLST